MMHKNPLTLFTLLKLYLHNFEWKETTSYSNQIRVVAFMCTTAGTSLFFFTKNSNVAKCFFFFYVCNAETTQCCQKLTIILVMKWFQNWNYQKMYLRKYVAQNWYFSMKKLEKIRAFLHIENRLWMSKIRTNQERVGFFFFRMILNTH